MTYPATRTFWLEATDRVAVGLRRYRSAGGAPMTCEGGYHSVLVFTGEEPADFSTDTKFDRRTLPLRRPAPAGTRGGCRATGAARMG
jgi:hypothetical protein